ncbi:MAG TPA: CGNR zinc finger domain-containing protein [Candidatus Saccharimonadales bacterium]|nr:CGNR zinc finger domain-containing protein [Candidatus Saccharimonadales bacterium]
MNTNTLAAAAQGHHAHDVSLDGTFDFLNTNDLENGFPLERLPSLDVALTWFVERGVIHHDGADRLRDEAAANPEAAARDLTRIHRVRDALREVADAIAEQRVPEVSSLDTVNQALHARQVIELVPAPDGVSVDHRHVGDPIDDALARLADPLVSELTSGHPQRIRICDNETCRWVFYDTSRTGKRRWCDMATCGNRAKAARHRARAKAAEEAVDEGAIRADEAPSTR